MDLLQKVDYEKRDFDNLDPKDYGIDFEEEDNTYGECFFIH